MEVGRVLQTPKKQIPKNMWLCCSCLLWGLDMNVGKDVKTKSHGFATQEESCGAHVVLSAWPTSEPSARSQSQSVGLKGPTPLLQA